MQTDTTIIGEARDHEELVALLRQRKMALQVSDQCLDELAGLAVGHSSKVLGPVPVTALGRITLSALLGALALKLVVVEDKEQAASIGKRWHRKQVHHDRAAALSLKQARPIILSRGARKAAKARWEGVTPEAKAAFIASLNAARAAKRKRHARLKRTV
jgi:hypothetical protein